MKDLDAVRSPDRNFTGIFPIEREKSSPTQFSRDSRLESQQLEEEVHLGSYDVAERRNMEKRKLDVVRADIERLTMNKMRPGVFDSAPFKKWLVQGDIKKLITRKMTNMKEIFKQIDTLKLGYATCDQIIEQMVHIQGSMNLAEPQISALSQHLTKYYKDTKISEAVFHNILRLF